MDFLGIALNTGEWRCFQRENITISPEYHEGDQAFLLHDDRFIYTRIVCYGDILKRSENAMLYNARDEIIDRVIQERLFLDKL